LDITIPIELLPVPQSLFDFAFALIGWQLGRAFALFDAEFLKAWKNKPFRYTLFMLLHFFHHYWIGLLLIVCCQQLIFDWNAPFWTTQGVLRILLWIGYGLFIEDGAYHISVWVRRRLIFKEPIEPSWFKVHFRNEDQLSEFVAIAAKHGLCWRIEKAED